MSGAKLTSNQPLEPTSNQLLRIILYQEEKMNKKEEVYN